MEQWKSYLLPAEFIINTDQKSLVHLSNQHVHSYWQQKVMTKLLGYQYKICYKKGTTNCAADALSRAPQPSGMLHALAVALPT